MLHHVFWKKKKRINTNFYQRSAWLVHCLGFFEVWILYLLRLNMQASVDLHSSWLWLDLSWDMNALMPIAHHFWYFLSIFILGKNKDFQNNLKRLGKPTFFSWFSLQIILVYNWCETRKTHKFRFHNNLLHLDSPLNSQASSTHSLQIIGLATVLLFTLGTLTRGLHKVERHANSSA